MVQQPCSRRFFKKFFPFNSIDLDFIPFSNNGFKFLMQFLYLKKI